MTKILYIKTQTGEDVSSVDISLKGNKYVMVVRVLYYNSIFYGSEWLYTFETEEDAFQYAKKRLLPNQYMKIEK
jgi:hypothetical protein